MTKLFETEVLENVKLIMPAFANSVDPDKLASKKPTDLDLYCLSFNLDQIV